MPEIDQNLLDFLLTSPETCQRLAIASAPANNPDGSFSFLLANEDEKWRLTVRMEEVSDDESVGEPTTKPEWNGSGRHFEKRSGG